MVAGLDLQPDVVGERDNALGPACIPLFRDRSGTGSPTFALAEMNPGSGEIIWSTLFPPEIARAILDQDGDG